MSVLDAVHGRFVFPRRVEVLSQKLAALLPRGARVLDVGSGDGTLARRIHARRTDVTLEGIDVLLRADATFPVRAFDGTTIPHPDKSFDVVMLVDVLHHTADPVVLLGEAARVARRAVLVKDHVLEGPGAALALRFMDRVGNARHGVSLPFTYWPRPRWDDGFRAARLVVESWDGALGLYPPPLSWLFERSLHFVARLRPEVP